jgi:hypothetical protein
MIILHALFEMIVDIFFGSLFESLKDIPWVAGIRSAKFAAALANWVIVLLGIDLVVHLLKGNNRSAAVIFSLVALGFFMAAFRQTRSCFRKQC